MDQEATVTEPYDSGNRLIRELANVGFDVEVAFWARPSEEDKSYLYVASPFVDKNGLFNAYLLVHATMRNVTDLCMEPHDVRLLATNDSLTRAALKVAMPVQMNGPHGNRQARLIPGMTRFGGSSLGGMSIDGGALIYPPLQSA